VTDRLNLTYGCGSISRCTYDPVNNPFSRFERGERMAIRRSSTEQIPNAAALWSPARLQLDLG